jgi:maltose O-acetyltransferase
MFKGVKAYIIKKIALNFQSIRKGIYRNLSATLKIEGRPQINQPVLYLGEGSIVFGRNVNIGYFPSPFFYSGNAHFEARTKESKIAIGDNVYFNNNFVAISEVSITIGNNVLIGTNVELYDSDFHNIEPHLRFGIQTHPVAPIKIEDNVWLGSNVKILKGVTIGENSVISNGAVVTKNIPANVVAGGIPAKIIKNI